MKLTIDTTSVLLCLIAGLCSPYAAGAGEHPNPRIRILLITGMDHPAHDWKKNAPVVKEILEKDPRMAVEILEDPYRLESTDLSPFQAVFINFNNWEKPDPSDRAKSNLQEFVRRGGGLVVMHFACGAFGGWPEYGALAGRIWDKVNTHDPRGPFRVEIVNPSHPITRGLKSFETDDELYTCLTGEKQVDILAVARSKTKGSDQLMAFVHQYGKGRVFQTPLGHDARAIRIPETAELIRRGSAWAAGL